jgi:2-hydroxychromene-2-carboxylate isomerase
MRNSDAGGAMDAPGDGGQDVSVSGGAPPVEFWFDFGSTYSYVAAVRADNLASAAGISLKWKPFLLGPLFRRQGWDDSPFNLFAARGRYMWRDVERLCEDLGHPFRKPSVFPRNGLLAARVACSAEEEAWMPSFARAVFVANFARNLDISEPAIIAGIMSEMGLDSADLIERASSPVNKARLREQTDRAWESGIFGAPTFVTGGEIFWGNDRLEEALAWNAKER